MQKLTTVFDALCAAMLVGSIIWAFSTSVVSYAPKAPSPEAPEAPITRATLESKIDRTISRLRRRIDTTQLTNERVPLRFTRK